MKRACGLGSRIKKSAHTTHMSKELKTDSVQLRGVNWFRGDPVNDEE